MLFAKNACFTYSIRLISKMPECEVRFGYKFHVSAYSLPRGWLNTKLLEPQIDSDVSYCKCVQKMKWDLILSIMAS